MYSRRRREATIEESDGFKIYLDSKINKIGGTEDIEVESKKQVPPFSLGKIW